MKRAQGIAAGELCMSSDSVGQDNSVVMAIGSIDLAAPVPKQAVRRRRRGGVMC